MLLLADEGLFGQVVPTLLHSQHGPMFPVPGLLDLIIQLGPELPLIGDGRGHLPLGLGQLVPHVQDDLIQHLLRVFRPGDQIVDIRFEQGREFRKDPHILSPPGLFRPAT
jgi:hypothetical protein